MSPGSEVSRTRCRYCSKEALVHCIGAAAKYEVKVSWRYIMNTRLETLKRMYNRRCTQYLPGNETTGSTCFSQHDVASSKLTVSVALECFSGKQRASGLLFLRLPGCTDAKQSASRLLTWNVSHDSSLDAVSPSTSYHQFLAEQLNKQL
jgi:hypothetical protein